MTDEITPPAPVIIDAAVTVPVEQKSPELSTTEPKTLESNEIPVEKEPEKPIEKPVEDKEKLANDSSLERIKERIRTDELERQLTALKPVEQPLGERPKIEQFNTLEEYDKAVDSWAERKGMEKANQQFNNTQSQREQLAIKAAVMSRDVAARTKYTDYDSVVSPLVPVIGSIPVLKEFIGESEMGSEVAYHLAKNPTMLEELTRLSPFAVGRQLLTLEMKLKTTPIINQTTAPDPIKPVGSRESIKPKLADLATKDINGFIAKRNKEELAKMRPN